MSDLNQNSEANQDDCNVSIEDPLERVRARARRVADYINTTVSPLLPDKERTLVDQKLAAVTDALAERPDVSVALLGSSGVGKSTLINSIVGLPILSEDDRRFCTAAVTVLRCSPQATFRAILRFLNLEEWQRELDACRGDLIALQEESGEEQDAESKELIRYYMAKLRAVYGIEADSPIDFESLTLPSDIRRQMLPGSEPLILEHTDVRDFKALLKQYVTSKGRYWPLVQTVEIEGPFESLRSGIQLVDLPGVNDPNPAREEITRKYLKSAPHIWLIFNTRRGITKDVSDLLLEQNLLRQFMLEGKVDAFTLVGTHAEAVDHNEQTLEDYQLPSSASPAELIRARNAEVVRDVQGALKDIADAIADRAGESQNGRQLLQARLSQAPIFTIASKDYQKLRGITRGGYSPILTEAETQVPSLIAHLGRIATGRDAEAHAREQEKRLDLLLREIHSFFRSFRQQLSARGDDIQHKRDELANRCQRPREKLGQRLREAMETAERTFEARKEVFGERLNTAIEKSKRQLGEVALHWAQMHWSTLRATVARDGAFVSPSTGQRYNLNEDICRPLLDSIPFTWDEFFGAQLDKLLAVMQEGLEGHADLFIAELQLEALKSHLIDERGASVIESGLDVAKESLKLQINNVKASLEQTIRQTRIDLSGDIAVTVGSMMTPAYGKAKVESGRGIKSRILNILNDHVRASVVAMFDTVQRDLTEGVGILGGQLSNELGGLEKYYLLQADQVLQNLVGAGVDAHGIDVGRRLKDVDAILAEFGEKQSLLGEGATASA